MNLNDRIQELSKVKIDTAFVAELEKAYGVSLPDEVKRLVSLSKEAAFYDDFLLLRGLSQAEITDASSDMAVDFLGEKLLPIFDVGDNDYIVYDIANGEWCRFNIADEIRFSSGKSLFDMLN
jgi:hypothetical protein